MPPIPTPTMPVPKQANKAEEEKAKIGKPITIKELVMASSLRFEYLSAKNANDTLPRIDSKVKAVMLSAAISFR